MKERLGKGGGEIVGLEATDRTRVKKKNMDTGPTGPTGHTGHIGLQQHLTVYPSLTCAINSSLLGLNTMAPSIWSKARLACPISESTNAYLERAWK